MKTAQEAFNDLLARCQRITQGTEETPATKEEADQLASWLIENMCGKISDKQLQQFVDAKRQVALINRPIGNFLSIKRLP